MEKERRLLVLLLLFLYLSPHSYLSFSNPNSFFFLSLFHSPLPNTPKSQFLSFFISLLSPPSPFFFLLSLSRKRARDFEFFVRGRFVYWFRSSTCSLWFPFIS